MYAGYGDPSYGVLLLGIAPGEREMEKGRPFIGQSGQLLDGLLKYVDWPREQTYATNLICYWNNAPSAEEVAGCGERLRAEIEWAQPKVIVSLGGIVTSRLTGTDPKRKTLRGSTLWSKEFGCYVITTRHPAGALRANSMSMAQDIIRDLEKIPLVLTWPMDGSVANVVVDEIITDEPTAQRMLDALPLDRPVVIDIETSSKSTDETETDVFVDALLRIGFRWEDMAGREHIVVWRPGAWSRDLVWPAARWQFQFGTYDTMGIWRELGVRLPIVEDLGLKSYCCDERSGQHGLKILAREYQAAGWYDEALEKDKRRGTMDRLPDDVIDEYNGKDVAYTGRMDPILTAKMERDGTTGLYRDLLIPAYNMYRDAQYYGIGVDFSRLVDLGYLTWLPRYNDMVEELVQHATDLGFQGDINLNSNIQLKKLMFQIVGLTPIKKTPKGAPSLDKEVLDRLDHPFLRELKSFRALDKIMDYVFSIQRERKLDGLVHPSALLHSVRTGRRSYKRPAMQTIPQEYTVGAEFAEISSVFVPHNPKTHGMLKADYEQIEVWEAWVLSRDPVLLEHLLSGDIHSATAEAAFKISRLDYGYPNHRKNPLWDVKRQGAKKVRFGLQYGEGAEKLSSPPPVGLGCTTREAQEFIDNYWSVYDRYARWMVEIQAEARKEGELRTPTGRIMRFPIILDHKQLRQAINFPIQSIASDHVLIAAIELHERLREYNSFFLLDVHDALWIEYDLRFEREVCELVREVMERPKFPGYPNIPAEIAVGPNLRNMTKVPRKDKWELCLAA
jgi:uracil-DNA glycosylase family 4